MDLTFETVDEILLKCDYSNQTLCNTFLSCRFVDQVSSNQIWDCFADATFITSSVQHLCFSVRPAINSASSEQV